MSAERVCDWSGKKGAELRRSCRERAGSWAQRTEVSAGVDEQWLVTFFYMFLKVRNIGIGLLSL